MALQIRSICTAIHNLDVSGVVICDLNSIPESVDPRQPTLFPEPSEFVSDLVVTNDSFGSGLTGKKTAAYILTYTFCYAPVGEERGLFAAYPEMIDAAYRIIDAIIAADPLNGSVTSEINGAMNFGLVNDPAGQAFHGCQIQIRVTEFVN